MKGTLRKVLLLLLALVFVGSGVMAIADQIQKRAAEKSYQEAAGLVNLPEQLQGETESVEDSGSEMQAESSDEPEKSEPEVYVDPYADALRAMDFTALREVNPDVLGWIMIPDTKISYPLVQGNDNDYYLKRTWRKSYSSVGSIFVEQACSGDLSDFNTIIYGHHMNNGSMFASLEKYLDPAYLAAHPYVYITNDAGCHTYQIFSAMEAPVESPVYVLDVTDPAAEQAVLNWCLTNSEVDTGVVPVAGDRIVTLSTCTGNGYETRYVVQGVLIGSEPAAGDVPAEDVPAGTVAEEQVAG